ncbi:hypothetical protein DU508_15840 [Pedobacter chinensis]|uniref:Uncharacterized protein n=1 Tax=Pedobacter chinensis TaxID=2282421 RepID=A0A369PU01_9SPHI|nr:hypothetical protein [Pedobacter chinensis]RDC55740.1 hypothetical protein DU508_15840 [Pedobacter chinensis]
MLANYKILYRFENAETLIMEVQRLDLPDDADIAQIYHWLYFDKLSLSMVKLWFRSMDSSAEIEERYFEQGYLKFSETEATFIEKYNSSQHKLANDSKLPVNEEINRLIQDYFKQP